MSDSWIDKNELDDLVSGFSAGKRSELSRQLSSDDIFDDIPAMPFHSVGPQPGRVSPHIQPAAQVHQSVQNGDSPLQVLVSRAKQLPVEHGVKFSSPFALDDDDEFDEIESQIEHLASETAKALRVLQEVRARADRNGLLSRPVTTEEPEIHVAEKEVAQSSPAIFEEVPEPLDRIPLDVEIDPDLSLKGRLQSLAEILKTYVGMEEMMVVDRDGFSLFSSGSNLTVGKSVGEFVNAIRKVYDSESDARSHTASQLAVENDKWICIIPTDGEIDGKFLLKALLPTPLDRPEIYVLAELLNEVLRPEAH